MIKQENRRVTQKITDTKSTERLTNTQEDHETDDKMLEIHQENGMFPCFCEICMKQSAPGRNISTLKELPIRLKKSLEVRERNNYYQEHYKGEQQTFFWLMKHLLPYTDKIKGCECLFMDTVFFENGEP